MTATTTRSLTAKVLAGDRIDAAEAMALYRLPLADLGALAHHRRRLAQAAAYGGRGNEIVTYIVDRNINYSNVCAVGCSFCAFYRTARAPDHYVLDHATVDVKLDELAAAGGTQVLLQGGHHPTLPLAYYLDLLGHLRAKYPRINIHGFSPPEFIHFSRLFQIPLPELLGRFRDAGLGSIPGGGAEILVDRVRGRISPHKCTAAEWLAVMREAHRRGLRTSATMMFGHVETVADRLEHLRLLRDLQDETGGFTAFICWTFQSANTRLTPAPGTPRGPTDYLRTQAMARIFLDNFANVQGSWVTQGPSIGQLALAYGANDFGSVMMEENVVSSAGTAFQLAAAAIERLIAAAGYQPRRRDTWYQLV